MSAAHSAQEAPGSVLVEVWRGEMKARTGLPAWLMQREKFARLGEISIVPSFRARR